MFNTFSRFIEVIRNEGLAEAFRRTLHYVLYGVWVRRQIFRSKNSADTFRSIYESNYWGSKESVSGTGSEMSQTKNIREHLPIIFDELQCETVFDGPCGDFGWMRHVIASERIKYIGGDIVGELIQSNTKRFGDEATQFIEIDICNAELPRADLMICRDCLFHLSYYDIKNFLINFSQSNIPYLLVTTHIQIGARFRNRDIKSGDFRMLDLFSHPFNFNSTVLYRFDDYQHPEPQREMFVITKQSVATAIDQWI